MAKRRVDLLLDGGLVGRVDEAAARLRWSRTTFVAAALEGALGDARRGMSGPPALGEGAPLDDPPARVASPPRASVRRTVPARPPDEPNVDYFEKTYDYRAAMGLWRRGQPYEHLLKESKRG